MYSLCDDPVASGGRVELLEPAIIRMVLALFPCMLDRFATTCFDCSAELLYGHVPAGVGCAALLRCCLGLGLIVSAFHDQSYLLAGRQAAAS